MIAPPTTKSCKKMLEAQSKIKDLTEARQSDGDEQRVSNDNDPQLMGEAKTAKHDMFDMIANQSSNPLSLEEREPMLNVDQRRIYDNLHAHLQHKKGNEVGAEHAQLLGRACIHCHRIAGEQYLHVHTCTCTL